MFARVTISTILSESIIPSFFGRLRVLDISFLMGFTTFNSVQGWQRGRKSDKGFLPYPNRRYA